ncbi:protease complex subunit PrcB family protein [Marinobacter sp. CHS3-4]|uniref:protease complex subunit PrcB family protein n=1 Tax=Marinobacter sp. CHS3-4 TaxID=3045174 RepID=UPI0024B5F6E4|nr:protease complex subunit PrcB family protein [Marinobacter sp. CHS3-4]MDI9244847.1 protease complex subunit PrcB family protein [Marinobacter sp. CHS3-4]
MRRLNAFTGAVVFLALTACSHQMTATPEGAPLARQITESDQCGVGSEGLTYIASAQDLTRLKQWTMQNLSMKPMENLNFEREHLLIVGLGQKPTGGFGLTLASSQIVDSTLRLTVFLRRPPADAVVTQVLTTPCAVLAVTPGYWSRVEVNGNGLESLTLNRKDNR